MNTFSSPFGDYDLFRYPQSSDPNLQAWDAADRYILTHLADNLSTDLDGTTVVCNDEFGALTTALHRHQPVVWNDSVLAHEAIRLNFDRNDLVQDWSLVNSVDGLDVGGQPVGLVVLKVPKSLAFLEDQLARLAPLLTRQTVVIGAAKAKHIHTSTLDIFEKYIGRTTTSLAKQKARLIFAEPRNDAMVPSPWPQSFDYAGRPVLGHAGVFAHRKLDQGTRFLLEQIKNSSWAEGISTIVDVGCGNGLLGLQTISQNENITCIFTDRSYMALDSARLNIRRWFPDADHHRFVLSDALTSVSDPGQLILAPASVDLVLCNPPFHDNYVMGEETATKMFSRSAQLLKTTGRLVVVANRHLRYLPILKRLYHSVTVEASTKKFVVLVAERAKK